MWRLLAVLLLCPAWAVAGDSVTYDSADELQARGAVVEAFGGVTISQGRPTLRRFASEGEETVVVALGIMDVAQYATATQLRARVRGALVDLRTVDCVIWVDLRLLSTIHDDWPARVRVFNDIIEAEAPHVAHWSWFSHGHRNWFRADGFHPNRLGQAAYARFLAGQVNRRCPQVQPSAIAHRLRS